MSNTATYRELSLTMYTSCLQSMDIDGPEPTEVQNPISVQVPAWLYNAAMALKSQLDTFNQLISELNARQSDIEQYLPHLTRLQDYLVDKQNWMYDQVRINQNALLSLQESQWRDFIAISNQFADHVGLALRAAKDRSDDTFKSLVEQADRQAGYTEEIVRFVKNLANEKRHEVDALRAGNEETQRQLAEFKVQLHRLTRER
jgi:ABC-type transporter Mla subunit MlaD